MSKENRKVLKLKNLSTSKKMILGFFLIIVVGTLLLMLPISNRTGHITPWKDAAFTAVSATCVTGLILHDTYVYWSLFGQIVIMILLEVGGLGFITLFISALTFSGRKIGFRQRLAMQESLGASQLGGIVKMARFILSKALIIEGIGAFLLCFYFCPKVGILRGIYFSIFHAISAFCNGGMDLMGYFQEGSSLMTANTNVYFNIVIMFLITAGGIGFYVWDDVGEHLWHFSKYRLQSKIVLLTSCVLTFGGALILFILNYNCGATEGLSVGNKILTSLFQSVTCRTAGFQSVDLTAYTQSGKLFMVILMLIGGSSGSTAGGLKTSTAAVLFMSILVVFKKKRSLECFHKKLNEEVIHNACCLLMMYLFLSVAPAIAISSIENCDILSVLFETSSAIGTVGLSLGMTSTFSTASHIILMLLMFIGRMGGLTVLLAFSSSSATQRSLYPEEKITVG